jgi:hypothetical protein
MAKDFNDEIDYTATPAASATPATAPITLASLAARITATTTDAAALATANEIANNVGVTPEGALVDRAQHADATPIKALHAQDPVRVTLRTAALAHRAGLLRARLALVLVWWRMAFAALAEGIQRPVAASAPSGLSLEQSLTSMAAPVTGTSSGSLADGTMRGVGFSTAQGYVTALANGVKQATAAHYVGILRGQYGYTDTQIAALTVTVIAESALPVGAGIVHDHTVNGKTALDLRREAAVEAAKVIRETADATTLALAQRLIVDDSPDAWWEIGWTGMGAGNITRGELVAATGSDELAPKVKVDSTALTRTIHCLRGTHDADMVTTRPVGVKVRWQIGRGQQHAAYVGAEYGKVLAIVDLNSDGTLTFDGDATIADEVRTEYNRIRSTEELQPGDVTAWLSSVLRSQHGAVRSGDRYLVSPKHKAGARELCNKIAAVWSVGGWVRGRLVDGVPELGVTYQDVATVIGGIWQGIAAEVTEAEDRWVKTVTDAKGGRVGVRACTNEIERIDGAKPGDGLVARINGMALIGEGPLKVLRDRVTALRAKVAAALVEANDPTAERFANIELK